MHRARGARATERKVRQMRDQACYFDALDNSLDLLRGTSFIES